MRDARTNYVIVGSFVLLMLAAMIVTVALLTGRTGAADTFYTELPHVGGIKFGSKVTYDGFVIGTVEDIDPVRIEGRTRFRVKLAVREGWPVPEGSVARITAPGILAAVVVDIKGSASEAMLKPGSDIPGAPAANIFAVMNDMSAQVTKLNQDGLLPLMATLNQQVAMVGGMLEKQAPELLANLAAISTDLAVKAPRITADVQKMTGTLATSVVNDQNAARIGASLQSVAELTAGLQDSRKKLDGIITAIDANKGNVDSTLKDLRHTLQAVARTIDSVTYNLEGTSRNVHEFSRQIRDNPGVLIGGTKGSGDGPGGKR
jgi:phospholipid/cholesterol/gamma-HCH transport system substrate-binding protein